MCETRNKNVPPTYQLRIKTNPDQQNKNIKQTRKLTIPVRTIQEPAKSQIRYVPNLDSLANVTNLFILIYTFLTMYQTFKIDPNYYILCPNIV